MNEYEKMANSFEVEELEERVEFSGWSGECTADSSGQVECTVKREF